MQNPQSSVAASAADTRAAKTETATIKARRIERKIPCFNFYVLYSSFCIHPKFAVGGVILGVYDGYYLRCEVRSGCNVAWKEIIIMIMIISLCVELGAICIPPIRRGMR
ncbi:hypothetical protein P692DRAFT_20829136 [Suillus brevipes Sb2]|nr:hypothetical protein P692DRAFT_20829136 [Suillus brevipes Sb2]